MYSLWQDLFLHTKIFDLVTLTFDLHLKNLNLRRHWKSYVGHSTVWNIFRSHIVHQTVWKEKLHFILIPPCSLCVLILMEELLRTVQLLDAPADFSGRGDNKIDVCKTLMPPFPNMWRVGLTLPFDLLTWISIGIIYSSRTIYIPSLKVLGQSVLELSVAQSEGDWHDLWPTDLNINRDNLIIKDYLPTKFETSEAKRSWVTSISCTRYKRSTWPWPLTYWPEYQ